MKPSQGSARLFAALALVTGLSQFHRAALGVVGPELAADLGAGAGLLGAANGAFFAALLLMQVPVGLALDRIGPRLTVAALALPAAAGALGQALAGSAEAFLAARFLLGIGCGASFMASVVLAARWYAGAGLTTALARIFAMSQAGILLAGAPFALAAEWLGWRGAYAAGALLTLALSALWWLWARDDPPDRIAAPRPAETLIEALRGQVAVWRTPGLLPVLAMHFVGYAAMATVIAVWAGPYLAEVHGMAPEARGAVLFAMGWRWSPGCSRSGRSSGGSGRARGPSRASPPPRSSCWLHSRRGRRRRCRSRSRCWPRSASVPATRSWWSPKDARCSPTTRSGAASPR